MKLDHLGEALITTTAFTILGLVIFGGSFWIAEKIMPFSIRKEIEEDQNVALGVIIAGIAIALALVISAAISG
jgi:putative membrane protein